MDRIAAVETNGNGKVKAKKAKPVNAGMTTIEAVHHRQLAENKFQAANRNKSFSSMQVIEAQYPIFSGVPKNEKF